MEYHRSSIDNRVGDRQQSRDQFRTRGPSEVVVFTPQKVSQEVDFLESIIEIPIQLCEGNFLSDVGAINRFSDEQLLSVYFFLDL